MWRSGRPSVKPNEVDRLLPAFVGLFGLIMAGHILSPPGMNGFYAAVNKTIGVVFLWGCTSGSCVLVPPMNG
jgi:hypothetical protein